MKKTITLCLSEFIFLSGFAPNNFRLQVVGCDRLPNVFPLKQPFFVLNVHTEQTPEALMLRTFCWVTHVLSICVLNANLKLSISVR